MVYGSRLNGFGYQKAFFGNLDLNLNFWKFESLKRRRESATSNDEIRNPGIEFETNCDVEIQTQN